jgi:hypothetical protein
MAAEWLRQRFAAPPEWEPELVDQTIPDIAMTAASVLIPLIQRPEGLSLLHAAPATVAK